MCKAIDDMLSEREAKGEIRGIEIGELRMLVKQVKNGRLTIEEAAEDAAMSVEKFRNVTDDMLKEGQRCDTCAIAHGYVSLLIIQSKHERGR